MSLTNTAARTLDELLSHHNEHFIQSAYNTLLGREPDSDGMKFYLARMQAGVSKIEILAQLRNSKEGKSRPVKIAGLDKAIRRHKQLKTPLIGNLLRHAGLKQLGCDAQTNLRGIGKKQPSKLIDLLDQHGLNESDLPPNLTLETIHRLNPHDHFDDLDQALSTIVQQPPIHKLRIYDADELNANFYVKLALNKECIGLNADAVEFYRLSLMFASTPIAHEHLGNHALDGNRCYQAAEHYKAALDLKSQSPWVYANLARTQALSGHHKEALDTICAGINVHTGSDLLMSKIDESVSGYWQVEEQKLDFFAATQNREILIIEYGKVTSFICDSYAKAFRRNSSKPVNGRINENRVLIIGLTYDAAPQCFRYRISQKIEQLSYAGYQVESVAWHEQQLALNKINSYDIIIFYRTPAFPGVLKLVEYAKSLGKITFFEVDDLLFETVSVPPIETYGGQVSLSAYLNVTKDIGSYRAMAASCDYAIASTLPLLEKLAPLVRTKIGYLHRNGLDKYSGLGQKAPVEKSYVNLFYGSGTLAHNSDFIIEALPAISKILREFGEVKLTIAGYLTLPPLFLREFEGRIIRVPFVKDVAVYAEYLRASDINLAVLHDDVLTSCKSELKWFEAAVFSIPSVVSRTQNYVDVVKHGEDGFIVHGEGEWYSTLRKLVENPELRKMIGHKAFVRVTKEYSVEALANNVDKIIMNAVADYRVASEKRHSKEMTRATK